MQKIIKPERNTWSALLKRQTTSVETIEDTVNQIFSEVRDSGDKAVSKYTRLYDGIEVTNISVATTEIDAAEGEVPVALKEAIQLAKSNIEIFHKAQKTEKIVVETTEGVNCWLEKRPIQKVGLYIPGGSAPLFSTILMLGVPAGLAGCSEIVLCTPPDKNGNINPVILYTAKLCGITKVCKVGGIQAIAAMTFGTETISQVYKIFGPGNQFVTVAKQIATKFGVAIDMPAGPSELLIFADKTANPAFVAADLLSQAEHGADSQVILVSTSETVLDTIQTEIYSQLQDLPRKAIAEKALANSRLICVKDYGEALELINSYGPEHFSIVSEQEAFFIDGIVNAGSVFIGPYSAESAGDYASGTNHTLPTNGYTRQYSGVNLDSFLKSITFQKISKKGINNIGPSVELMAEAEGLQAHKNAITLRLRSLNQSL